MRSRGNSAVRRALQLVDQNVQEQGKTGTVAQVVQRPALVVTRDIEWGQVLLGFEQANRYNVRDETGAVVALLMEEHGGIGRVLGRQLLRTRRGFTATGKF